MKRVNQPGCSIMRYSALVILVVLVTACSSRGQLQTAPLQATQQYTQEINANKTDVPNMDLLYATRTWAPPQDLTLDPVEAAKNVSGLH